ncbi:MAG TPA: hypothetical protein VEW48_21185 [Thermoanaerobaculia bacterium]|nr:hypothetical protein [Thermoanaerobaculia bacterium]
METQSVQELKAERVQEELAAVDEMPFQISLKAERVQDPMLALSGAGGIVSTAYELSFNLRSVAIEIGQSQISVTVFESGGPKAA